MKFKLVQLIQENAISLKTGMIFLCFLVLLTGCQQQAGKLGELHGFPRGHDLNPIFSKKREAAVHHDSSFRDQT